MRSRRLWALGALAAALAALVLGVVAAVEHFPSGLTVLACLVAAGLAAAYGVRRRGVLRAVGLAAAALLVAGAITLVIVQASLLEDLLILAAVLIALAAARRAFTPHVDLPSAPPPSHPVLIYNPLSGDGKAKRFGLAGQARARGIEPIELRRGDDLEKLARDAVARGADPPELSWDDQGGEQFAVAVLVSNNPYRLGRALGSGTRPRLDRGLLGIAALTQAAGNGSVRRPLVVRQWVAPDFEMHAGA